MGRRRNFVPCNRLRAHRQRDRSAFFPQNRCRLQPGLPRADHNNIFALVFAQIIMSRGVRPQFGGQLADLCRNMLHPLHANRNDHLIGSKCLSGAQPDLKQTIELPDRFHTDIFHLWDEIFSEMLPHSWQTFRATAGSRNERTADRPLGRIVAVRSDPPDPADPRRSLQTSTAWPSASV